LRTGMEEDTYYADNDVSVTRDQVRLRDKVFPLTEVKWAGIEHRLEGARLGPWAVPPRVAYDLRHGRIPLASLLLYLILPAIVAGLFRQLLPPGNAVYDALAFVVFLAATGLMVWLLARIFGKGTEAHVLAVMGTFDTYTGFRSPDEAYIRTIAEAIKASLRDLNSRQKQEQTSGKG
jgi:hypothetical protein